MRGKQTVRDMVLSMAVVGAVAASIYVFIPHDASRDPVKRVDYQVELKTARRAAPYPVAAPEGLPASWRATSVSYEGGNPARIAWHLGFLNPQNEYVAVEQSNGRSSPFVEDVSQNAKSTGREQRVGKVSWKRYEGPKYDALVREERGVTTVVTGTASYGQLAKMAAALRTS